MSRVHIDDFVRSCNICCALAMEILQSRTKPSISYEKNVLHVFDLEAGIYGMSHRV